MSKTVAPNYHVDAMIHWFDTDGVWHIELVKQGYQYKCFGAQYAKQNGGTRAFLCAECALEVLGGKVLHLIW